MKPKILSFFNREASEELREAFVALSKEDKRKLFRSSLKRRRDVLETVLERNRGGFRLESIERDFETLWPSLERAILKRSRGPDAVLFLVFDYLYSEKTVWFQQMRKAVLAAADAAGGVEGQLQTLGQDYAGDSLWRIFAAMGRMGNGEVFREVDFADLPKQGREAKVAPTLGESTQDSRAEEVLAELESLGASARPEFEMAVAGKKFDPAALGKQLLRLFELASDIQSLVENGRNAARESASCEWEDVAGLRSVLKRLEAKAKLRTTIESRRLRLLGVREALAGLGFGGIRYRPLRESAEKLRIGAVAELDAAAALAEPPELPFNGEGLIWMDGVFSLRDDELDNLLCKLCSISLGTLGELVANVPREAVVFAAAARADTARSSSVPPHEADSEQREAVEVHAVPTAGAEESPSKATLTAIAIPRAVPECGHEAGALQAPTSQLKDDWQVRDAAEANVRVHDSQGSRESDLEILTHDVEVSHTGAVSERDGPAKAVGSESGCHPLSNEARGESSASGRAAQALAALDEKGLFSLMADYVAVLPADEARDLPSSRLLRLLALQPGLRSPDGDLAEQSRHLIQHLAEEPLPGAAAVRQMLWAGAIVPMFVDPGSAASAVLSLLADADLPPWMARFNRATLDLMAAIVTCQPSFIHDGASRRAWENTRDELKAQVRDFCDNAVVQKLNYQRASVVWHRLMGPGGELRNVADAILARATTAGGAKVEALIDNLQDPQRFRRLVDRTTREVSEGRVEPIIAIAYTQLWKRGSELLLLLRKVLEHDRKEPREVNFSAREISRFRDASIPEIERYVESTPSASLAALHRVMEGAVRRACQILVTLFRNKEAWGRPAVDPLLDGVIQRLRVPTLRLDPVTARPVGDPLAVREALEVVACEGLQSAEAAIDLRSRCGDIVGARRLLDAVEGRMASGDRERAREDLEERIRDWRTRSDRALKVARNLILTLRTMGVVAESVAAAKDKTMIGLEEDLKATEDFAHVKDQIDSIIHEFSALRDQEGKRIMADIRAAKIQEADVEQRLLRLAQQGDLATVREYMNRIQAGHALPLAEQMPALAGFSLARQNEIIKGLMAANQLEGVVQAARSGGRFAQASFEHHSQGERIAAAEWVQAWQRLRRSEAPAATDTVAVLTGLGFAVEDCSKPSASGVLVSDVQVAPTCDREVCPIPQFGSGSEGHLRILHLPSALAPELIVDRAQKVHGAGFRMAFAGWPIEPENRARLGRLCRDKQLALLVLDDAMIAHLAFVRGQRLTSFILAAAAYTWIDPFVSTSSLVPPEIFFGRTDALASLLDPHQQRCFVYGGRQLGKTALLREVERRFHQPRDHQFALWFDLLANGFGVEAEPPLIWDLLEPQFRALPGFVESWRACEKRTRRLEDSLVHWLEADTRRRFLLLLDEGDRFLDRDATVDYAESRRLKGIMDRTNRRFKVVFAGLHNVQRTTILGNHPLAHLGEPINVGAFSENGEWLEAYALVVAPLHALGYVFESADLPSRVLTVCNFYPGLLQQFGSRLLRLARQRSSLGPPYPISEEDVETVARDDGFRGFMMERFKWTLQLDCRYHYLAYTYAYLFQGDRATAAAGYRATDLRREVEQFRPREFSRLSADEFVSLLDEMQGLGVFRCDSGHRYSIRNANVLLLLGDKETVESELLSDRQLGKPEYRSESFHGPLRGGRNELWRRRVFTRPEEARLSGRSGAFVVVGTPMLESGLVEASLKAAFPQEVTSLSIQRLPELMTALRRVRDAQTEGAHVVLIGDTLPWEVEWIAKAHDWCNQLRAEGKVLSVVFQASSEHIWTEGLLERLPPDVLQVKIRKWSMDFIHPWLAEDNRPVPPDGDMQVVDLTGGWPRLLYRFARNSLSGATFSDALERTRGEIEMWMASSESGASFVGEGIHAARALGELRSLRDLAPASNLGFSSVEIEDAAALVNMAASRIRFLVARAELLQLVDRTGPGVYQWDPVFNRLVTRS